MAGPLESVLGFFAEGDPIFELESQLDDVLSHLAFDNIDMNYVKKVRGRLEKYRDFVKSHLECISLFRCESPVLTALGCLGNAYSGFVDTNWDEMNPQEITEEAEDILGEECFLGGELIPLVCALEAYENRNPDAWRENVKWRAYSDGTFEFEYMK